MSYGVEQTTIAYLERRYAALEKEIENALQDGPTGHPAIADLIYRKLIVTEEIKPIVVWWNLSAVRKLSRRDRSVFHTATNLRIQVLLLRRQ